MANFFLPAKADVLTQHTLATPGSYTWICPVGVTQIEVEAWGGGGGGGGSGFGFSDGQHGGGGGGYFKATVTVVPSQSYTLNVGAKGIGGIGPNFGGDANILSTAGGVSRISDSVGAIISAGGGARGASTGRTGGVASINQAGKVVTSTLINGGNGGNHNTVLSQNVGAFLGGSRGVLEASGNPVSGGGGASFSANGGNGANITGTGASENTTAGGGGGGAGYLNGQRGLDKTVFVNRAIGGDGGDGRLILRYTRTGGAVDNPPV